MAGVERVPVDALLGPGSAPKASVWARIARGEDDAHAVIRAIAAEMARRWGDVRIAVLWDRDVCVFSTRGCAITDLRRGFDDPTGMVTIVPREAIRRVVRTEQLDPTRKVGDLDPAARARMAGIASGFGTEIGGIGGPWPMVLAMVVNRELRAEEEFIAWQSITIETDDPSVGTLRLEICHDRVASHAVSTTLGGN